MGAVYKRATKKGAVRWLGRYRDKDKKEHSRSFDTRRAAASWVAAMENKGTAPVTDVDGPTVLTVWNVWTDREEISPGTRRVYSWTLKNLKPVETMNINDITRRTLDMIYKELITRRSWMSPTDNGISVENARAVLGRLRSAVVYYCSRNGLPVPEPFLSWRSPRSRSGGRRRVDPNSLPSISELRAVERVLRDGGNRTAVAPGIRPSPELADVLHIAAVTGLRIGELVGLDVDAVDLSRNMITVRQQLTASSRGPAPLKTPASRRVVPVPNQTMSLITRVVEESRSRGIPEGWSSPPLFLNERGNPWRPGGALRVLRKAQNILQTRGRSGHRQHSTLSTVDTWGWHSIRHLYASTLIQEGRPITEVAAVLGHSTPAITAGIYAHALTGYEEKIRDAAGSMVLSRGTTEEEYRERYGDVDD